MLRCRYHYIVPILFLLLSCGKKLKKHEYVPPVAKHFPTFPEIEGVSISKGGIELGQKLFYETLLSKNNKVSCASCHLQSRAFADNVRLSDIGNSSRVQRNAPVLFNLAWQKGFFWDGGSKNLKLQALGPISHHNELGADWKAIIKRLKKNKGYKKLFKKAFGSRKINVERITNAIAQFELSIVSDKSLYDSVQLGLKQYNAEQKRGYTLFKENCSNCHKEPLFYDTIYHNNGLDDDYFYTSNEDPRLGRYRITLDSNDLGEYKTASLRNLVYSSPYMHDGRFTYLEEVVDHYQNIDPQNRYTDKNLIDKRIEFTNEEKSDLILFLKTLTDKSLVQDSLYSKP